MSWNMVWINWVATEVLIKSVQKLSMQPATNGVYTMEKVDFCPPFVGSYWFVMIYWFLSRFLLAKCVSDLRKMIYTFGKQAFRVSSSLEHWDKGDMANKSTLTNTSSHRWVSAPIIRFIIHQLLSIWHLWV